MSYLTTIEKSITHQICPQKRFLKYHLNGNGVELVRRPVRDVTEEAIRRGVKHLLRSGDMEEACKGLVTWYMQECSTRGLVLDPDENAYDVALEQVNLAMAAVRGFPLFPFREIGIGFDQDKKQNAITDDEENPYMVKIHPALMMALPYDAMLFEVGGDQTKLLRVRVVSSFDGDTLNADLHGMESIALPYILGCDSTVIVYVQIGHRRRDSVGKKVQYSPWVRGYTNGMRIHWAKNYKNKAGKSVHLGDEWKSFKTWIETRECSGLAEWINFLAENDVLRDLYRIVEVNKPTEEEYIRWRDEIVGQEVRAEQFIQDAGTADADMLRAEFRMNRHSCDFPRPCEMQEICYENNVDPIGSGLYRERKLVKVEELWQQKLSQSANTAR